MAGKILKSQFAEFDAIKTALDGVESSLKNIVALGTRVGQVRGLGGVVKFQKDMTTEAAQLEKQQKDLAIAIAKLKTLHSSYNKELIKTNAQISQQTKEIKEQVMHTKSGVQFFNNLAKSVLAYGVAMVGITTIVNFFTRTLLDMTSRLNALEYSMKTIIKSNTELLKTQSFLSKTAISYGLDVLTLTERYIKFRAASLQSNMTATQTMKIFDSVAKAAGVLGLKTDEVNGVFLALEQMISKGKVTTEELRRQLGERLPGAMGIMADAIGVSIAELDKMLKAGTVLSSDALPKFAIALEEAYGIKAIKTIETLAAAQGRLKTSWVEFVGALNSSKVYIGIINYMSGLVKGFQDGITGQTADKMYRFLIETDKKFKILVENMSKTEEKGFDKRKKMFDDFIKHSRINLNTANMIWEEYQKKNAQLSEETQKNSPVFNLSEYKKTLDEAELDFKTYNDIIEKGLKDQFKGISAFVTDSTTTEKQYFQNQVSEIKKKTNESWKSYSELYDKTKNGQVKLTKEENIELEIRYNNYQQYVSALVELEKRLKEKKRQNEELDNARKQNEIDINNFIITQENKRLEFIKKVNADQTLLEKAKLDKIKDFEEKQQADLYYVKIMYNNKLIKIANGNKEDLLEIKKDETELLKDLENANTENTVANLKREEEVAKEYYDKQAQDHENFAEDWIANEYMWMNERNVLLAKETADKITAAKGDADEVERIKDEYNEKLLDNEIEILKNIFDANGLFINLNEEQYSDLNKKLADLQQKRYEADFDDLKKSNKKKKKEIQDYANAVNDIMNEGFSFQQQLSDNQLSRAQRMYDIETAMATDSVEQKMIADAKYEKEKRKIDKRQAILDKAQAAFNIIINTAQNISKAGVDVPLAILMGVLGAAELATVLAKPIPAYKEGALNSAERALMGEEGGELVKEPSGKMWVAKEKGIYNLEPHSIVYPHDETQRMLAQMAVEQTNNIVGLGETNALLRSINNNSKKSDTFWENGNFTYRKRGNIIYKSHASRRV